MNHLRDVLRFWAGSQASALHYWTRYVLPKPRAMFATRRLRGTRAHRRVFVFAAGPSMRRLDPHKVRRLQEQAGFDVFGVNAYVTTDFGRIAPPDLYVLSDPANWTRALTDEEVDHLPEAERSAARSRFRQSVESTWEGVRSANPLLFVPAEHYPLPGYADAFPFCAVSNVFCSNVHDITRPLATRPLTAYRALSIACFLGYQQIYVCGVDNDTFRNIVVDDRNVKWARYEHFYDDPEHVQSVPSREPLYQGLYLTALTFGCLDAFRGDPIVNLDPTGLVDTFPKQHDLDVYLDATPATTPRRVTPTDRP